MLSDEFDDQLSGDELFGKSWNPDELAEILHRQMNQPLPLTMAGLPAESAHRLRSSLEKEALLLTSMQQLLHHEYPPVEALEMVKDFVKKHAKSPGSFVPTRIATVIYFLAIVVARLKWGRRITKLEDDEVRRGALWAIRQTWIDSDTAQLLAQGIRELDDSES